MEDIYRRLAKHLESLIMGYPFHDALIDLLKEMFSPAEAEVAMAIPADLKPLEVVPADVIVSGTGLPESAVMEVLSSLSERNMIYSAMTADGTMGYAHLQVGYGMPQTFFWEGKQDERARKMAKLVLKYFTVPTTREVYGGTPTKSFRYSPADLTVDIPMQGVLPHELMGPIVGASNRIAVAHCSCRISARVLGRTDCEHSLEVCIKYDELAEFVITKGLAREISKDEALHILGNAEKEGLVHMVDNARGDIKHTCNCCGHYCWNVGIIRRRKIPRDVLMAVYFTRETETEECIGCGNCVDICPVNGVQIVDEKARVDQDWCIGCGVCAVDCPTGAISLKRRLDDEPPLSFSHLHEQIGKEKTAG